MSKNWKTISTLLIVTLTALLIGILIQFYNTPLKVTNVVVDSSNASSTVTNHTTVKPVIPNNPSGEIKQEVVMQRESGESQLSGEMVIVSGEKKEETAPLVNPPIKRDTPSSAVPSNDKTSQVIITSEDTMTNKEKREILTELDNTLMELLDVVNKVQPVDETRLETNESEVQR